MKIIYALIAACLSLQACNSKSETPIASTNVDEHSTLDEYTAFLPLLNDDDYTAAIIAIQAIKPVDGAEFEGTSRDDADTAWSTVYYLVDYDPTATVTPKIEQIAPGFQGDEDGGLAFENIAPAIEATPWP